MVSSRTSTPNARFQTIHPAFPGRLVPLLLLGLLTIHLARLGFSLPRYVGWIVLVWVLLASALMEPNGFPLGLIPSILLIVAGRKAQP